MFAVLESGNKQYFVEQDSVIDVDFLCNVSVGDKFNVKDVVFLDNGSGEVFSCKKDLESASIECEVIDHFKSDKILVFKKKRRKNYRKKLGYRDCKTRLKITKILFG